MEKPFLNTLLVDFVNWAQAIDDCRAIVLFGSAARGDHDSYSDRDIQVIAVDIDNDEYIDWMRNYSPIWLSFREHNVEKPLWTITYRGGHKVHLSIHAVNDLQEMVTNQELSFDYGRGYQVLLDKDHLATQLPPVKPLPYTPPTGAEFSECIENFLYGTIVISKYLKRGDLWSVQWAYGIERQFLLKMIEWHAHALNPDIDTWHRGERMQTWVRPDIWQALHGIVGKFDAGTSEQALFAMINLFTQLAQETARQLVYPYPDTLITEIAAHLKQRHQP